MPFADAKDSIEAAKLLLAYDMGKPTESLEIESPSGSMSPSRKATTAETRQELDRVLEALGGTPAPSATVESESTNQETEGGPPKADS